MTQHHRTHTAPTGRTNPANLSGPGAADLTALADLTGHPAIGTASLPAVTGPGLHDLTEPNLNVTEPNRVSAVDELDGVRLGPSFGGLPGGSPVRETPSEPPPANHLTALLSRADRPIPDRGD